MPRKKLAIITANLGDFEEYVGRVDQVTPDVDVSYFKLDDNNYPPRSKSMSPRLQSRIPKIFGWQMFPGYDYYLWVDSSFSMLHPDAAQFMLDSLGDNDIALFRHPTRKSITEEANRLRYCLSSKDRYIIRRYENELLDEELAEIFSDPDFHDDAMYAATIFCYRDCPVIRAMCKEWWYHTSRYHVIDQIGLTYLLQTMPIKISVIDRDIFSPEENPYFSCTRIGLRLDAKGNFCIVSKGAA